MSDGRTSERVDGGSLLHRGPLTASCWLSYCFEYTRESEERKGRNLRRITCVNLPFNAQIGQFLVRPISSLFTLVDISP